MNWSNYSTINSLSFVCGYCGNKVASNHGYVTSDATEGKQGFIYICPHCNRPTYFHKKQIPGVSPGNEVEHLPRDIEALYKESRECVAASAYTASVLICRKLLMNLAVAQGAEAGKKFIEYVDYLAAEGYVPPNGRGWVDHIRKKGNEATHEIVLMSKDDAEELIAFAEMLLKFIYEFPAKIPTTPTA
jgi:hypothetical protein